MNNRYVVMGVKAGALAIGLLAVFLLSKTIGEVVSWGKDSGIYPSRTITVMAEGEAVATSDIAVFTFTVNETGATSAEAQQKSETKVNNALKYLKENSVEDKDIKTVFYDIYPRYENTAPCYNFNCPTPSNRIIGYDVSQGVQVKVRDTNNAGKFLSDLTGFQINNVSGLAFTIDDEDILFDEARENAIQKAEEKAKNLSKNLRVRLGKVVSFSEDTPGMYPKEGFGGMEMMGARNQSSDVSLPQGENKYTTRVYVTYELK